MIKFIVNVDNEKRKIFLDCLTTVKYVDTKKKYENYVKASNKIFSEIKNKYFGVYFGDGTKIVKNKLVYVSRFVMDVIDANVMDYFAQIQNKRLTNKNMELFMSNAPYKLWSLVALKDECKRRGMNAKDYSKVTSKDTLISLLESHDKVKSKKKSQEKKVNKKNKKKTDKKSKKSEKKSKKSEKSSGGFDDMTSKEVRQLAKANGIKPKGMSKDDVIKKLKKKNIKPGKVSKKADKKSKKADKKSKKSSGNFDDMTLTALRKMARSEGIKPKGMSREAIIKELGGKSGKSGDSGSSKLDISDLKKDYKKAMKKGDKKTAVKLVKKLVVKLIVKDDLVSNRSKSAKAFKKSGKDTSKLKGKLEKMDVWDSKMKYLMPHERYLITKAKKGKKQKQLVNDLVGAIKTALKMIKK